MKKQIEIDGNALSILSSTAMLFILSVRIPDTDIYPEEFTKMIETRQSEIDNLASIIKKNLPGFSDDFYTPDTAQNDRLKKYLSIPDRGDRVTNVYFSFTEMLKKSTDNNDNKKTDLTLMGFILTLSEVLKSGPSYPRF